MSSCRKLKMERLSPIPNANQSPLISTDAFMPLAVCETPKHGFKSLRDSYAIETTSSPEVDVNFSSLDSNNCQTANKQRKCKSSAAHRSRLKNSSKKLASTPLSGLISRTTTNKPPRTTDACLKTWDCSSQWQETDAMGVNIIEEEPNFDISVEEKPSIGSFTSPQKSLVCNPSRHSKIITPNMAFPQKPIISSINNTPLSGIITKKALNLNRSYLNSLVEVDEDVDEIKEPLSKKQKVQCLAEHNKDGVLEPIEHCESPIKFPLVKTLSTMDFAHHSALDLSLKYLCKNQPGNIMDSKNFELIRCEPKKQGSPISEQTNPDRKNRKRALNFCLNEESLDAEPSGVKCAHKVLPLDLPEIQIEDELKVGIIDFSDSSNRSHKIFSSSAKDTLDSKSESESELGSVIESTPKSVVYGNECDFPIVKNDVFRGFTASSSLVIECGSPPQLKPRKVLFKIHEPVEQAEDLHHNIEIVDAASNDCFPQRDHSPKIVEHPDTSSSSSSLDSLPAATIETTLNDDQPLRGVPPIILHDVTKTPEDFSNINLNFTKRNIQAYESPSKTRLAFSEALAIGAFGSPDSTASNEILEEVQGISGEDVITTCSTTQEDEYVDESEQVKPRKNKKKGSLLERVASVTSKVEASDTLFDYEIKTQLRPSNGRFVSSPLVVCKMLPGDTSSYFLICRPLKHCTNVFYKYVEKQSSSLIVVIVSKLLPGLSEGSTVLIHFPISVVFCSDLKLPYALAGSQLVLSTSNFRLVDCDEWKIDSSAIKMPDLRARGSYPLTLFKVFSSNTIKSVSDAALGQCLIENVSLTMKVLHLVKFTSSEDKFKKVAVLCCDNENEACWLNFITDQDVRRASALEGLHILSDGSQVQINGFIVTEIMHVDKKTKNLLKYCSYNSVKTDFIFVMCPVEPTWVVSSSGAARDTRKISSSIDTVISQASNGKRYFLEVYSTETVLEKCILKSSSGQSVTLIQNQKVIDETSPMPCFLDGVYYKGGKVFADEYSRLLPKR